MPNTNGSLDGKVAFVTGPASGTGRATVLANVVVADIDHHGNQDTDIERTVARLVVGRRPLPAPPSPCHHN